MNGTNGLLSPQYSKIGESARGDLIVDPHGGPNGSPIPHGERHRQPVPLLGGLLFTYGTAAGAASVATRSEADVQALPRQHRARCLNAALHGC